tara:strand:+ start:20 stop:616 length:597 start_codon:yes stop_codon:yes gene_type:complete
MIVGLTGGIGSGKSAAGDFFIELGIDLIDADMISKDILDNNPKAKEIFIENFGEIYIDENNNINRGLLRENIFKDNKKKELLESIIHPIVKDEINEFILKSNSIYKIIMVPLIYETKSQDFYDKIIVIDCDEDYQIKRASQRDKKSKEDIINIIKNQATREERQSIADEIILNNSSLDDLKTQVIKVHQKLLGININE